MYFKDVVYKNFVVLSKSNELPNVLQSTPVISRQLGAKIRERELSGSPVISRFLGKAQTRDFQDSESHTVTSAPLKPKQYVER